MQKETSNHPKRGYITKQKERSEKKFQFRKTKFD
jgi:hypothetical protein